VGAQITIMREATMISHNVEDISSNRDLRSATTSLRVSSMQTKITLLIRRLAKRPYEATEAAEEVTEAAEAVTEETEAAEVVTEEAEAIEAAEL